MGKVATCQQIYTLQLSPVGEVFQGEVFAGGVGVPGMDVQVSDKRHWRSLA